MSRWMIARSRKRSSRSLTRSRDAAHWSSPPPPPPPLSPASPPPESSSSARLRLRFGGGGASSASSAVLISVPPQVRAKATLPLMYWSTAPPAVYRASHGSALPAGGQFMDEK